MIRQSSAGYKRHKPAVGNCKLRLAGPPNAGHYDAFISKYDAITANLPANEWLSVAFERVSFAPYFYESSGL